MIEAALLRPRDSRERHRGGDVGGGVAAGEGVVQVDGGGGGGGVVAGHRGVGRGPGVLLLLGEIRVEVSLQDLAVAVGAGQHQPRPRHAPRLHPAPQLLAVIVTGSETIQSYLRCEQRIGAQLDS